MRAVTGLRLGQKTTVHLSQVMRQALHYLQMDNAALCGMLVSEAAENPGLHVEMPEPHSDAPRRPLSFWRPQAGGDGGEAERLADHAPGLHAHVAGQIRLVCRTPREVAIADVFAEALEPSGWLGATLEEIASQAGCSHVEAENVLTRLQQMEPTGLFARSLAECLALQLAEQEALSDPMHCLLDNLPLLARGDLAALMRLCAADGAELGAMVAQVRRLDPKPGARFGDAPELRRAPDLIVTPMEDGTWEVALNRENLPRISVRSAGAGRDQIAAAKWIERTLSRRNQLVLEVARHVIARQQAFLKAGPTALVALTCTDVARELGYHDSTISRVRSGLLVQTPRGMLAMEAFFARIGARGEGAMPAAAVRAILVEMIGQERPSAPLGDRDLAEALAARGIEISRRAVANHRAQAGIPPARERRKKRT